MVCHIMKLSIVATLYKSAPFIIEFCQRQSKVAQQLVGDDYEIILVNDGSPDNSLQIALDLIATDSHITLVDLSRNFGHHKAIMTGLSYAKGDKIFLIDSDLEEEPEWLISFSKQMNLESCDVVYGVQEKRKGGIFERVTGRLFYFLFNFLTRLKMPASIVTTRLMTKRYVHALLMHEEREIFIPGLWVITGFNQQPQKVKKGNISETTYTLSKKLSLFVNSVTSFSNMPLVSIFYIGVLISIFSGFYVTWIIMNWMFFAKPVTGWTSLIGSIWLLGGMIITFIGIIGIYLSKIFSETKQRPFTIVRQVYTKSELAA